MIDLTKALTVDGWMSESELRWLSEQAQKYKTIVEVGSWMGRTTRALADNTEGTVVAVDTWEGSQENQEFLKDKPPNYLFQTFSKNLGDHLKTGKVSPVHATSLSAA